jgi:hypothetical protein
MAQRSSPGESLRGVTAASGGGDRAATREFLDEATDVARYVTLDSPDARAGLSPTKAGGGAGKYRWEEALELLRPAVEARR